MAPNARQSAPRHQSLDDGPHRRHARVVSHAPGRVRVRLRPDHRDAETLTRAEQHLGEQPGVATVTTNVRTGSLLLSFDHVGVSKADLFGMLYDAGIVARDLLDAEEIPEDLGAERQEHSTTATGLMDALTDLDTRLSRLTGGRIDIKLLVPVGMGILAARQIATVGLGLGQVPGYVLLWYAFDSFYKLHQRRRVADVAGPGSAIETVGAPPS